MKIYSFFLIAAFPVLLYSCSEKHLITDKNYRQTVKIRFSERQKLAINRKDTLFSVFNKNLSVRQVEALEFLFAFMPLSDLADYSGDFFLENANISLEGRVNSPWGKNIPEDIFLHYVLPPRVNNENLDSFRIVYQKEILSRISGLGLEDAALEINHWCHEKVTYQPSDMRTSGPMSTILSARGRCGEESTFTVSALRTAGIPARQVYTPRWAHTDDNHAWVEIWNNGKWYYMGACEPEPQLDLGWFTEPARRAMLIHSRSFGAPFGDENTINCSKNYCEVNALAKYAVTTNIFVKVIDENNLPAGNAAVEFQLYNYAEFYPLTVISTDLSGICRFETGLGDLLIWARKGDDFNFSKISVSGNDTVLLKLGRKASGVYHEEFDLKAPVLRSPLEGPPAESVRMNAERLETENEIRQQYIDSWMKPGEFDKLASGLGLDPLKTKELLAKSSGNFKEIVTFLTGSAPENRDMAVSLLGAISEKDLRDTKSRILNDHLKNTVNPYGFDTGDEIFTKYILNPRISNEMLTGYRGFFRSVLNAGFQSDALKDPEFVVKFINESVTINDEENYYKTPLTPPGVYQLKLSDSRSRAIYMVALFRTLGIPSRLEPGSNIPQYFFNSQWKDVYFSDQRTPSAAKGFLKIYSSENHPVPEYFHHFTIAYFQNGKYHTLEYDDNRRITDFREELILTPGHYMIVTGNRPDDKRVLADISFFDLGEGEHKSFEINIRKDTQLPELLGKINMDKLKERLSIEGIGPEPDFKKGIVLSVIEPDREPSRHILNDLPLLKPEFDSYGLSFVFLSADHDIKNPGNFGDRLPSSSVFLYDSNLQYLDTLIEPDSLIRTNLPLVFLSDSNGNILYKSSGYKTGIGEQILKRLQNHGL